MKLNRREDATSKEKIISILTKAKSIAKGETAEKINLALKALNRPVSWENVFTAGYYVSWTQGLAKQHKEETELCALLNKIEDFLTVRPS